MEGPYKCWIDGPVDKHTNEQMNSDMYLPKARQMGKHADDWMDALRYIKTPCAVHSS